MIVQNSLLIFFVYKIEMALVLDFIKLAVSKFLVTNVKKRILNIGNSFKFYVSLDY